MRRFDAALGIVLASFVWAAGCTESTISQVTAPSVGKCRPSFSGIPSSITSTGAKFTGTVLTTRDCQWTLVSDASWIAVSPAAGQGETSVNVQIAENPQGASRSAAITINDERVMVVQDPAPCRFQLSQSSIRIAQQGARAGVNVTTLTGCEWTASSTASWVQVARADSTGSGSVEMTVEVNGGASRTTTLTIAGLPFAVEQEGTAPRAPAPSPPTPPPTPEPSPAPKPPEPAPAPKPEPAPAPKPPAPKPPSPAPPTPCTYQIRPDRRSVPAAGTTETVRIETAAHCSWNAGSTDSWLHVLTSQGSGEMEIRYRVDPNAGSARSGTVTIGGQTHRVEQESAPASHVRFDGRVTGLSGSCPAVRFTADDRQVVTDGETRFRRGDCDDLDPGDEVEIEGEVQGTGPVRATRITFERGDDDLIPLFE